MFLKSRLFLVISEIKSSQLVDHILSLPFAAISCYFHAAINKSIGHCLTCATDGLGHSSCNIFVHRSLFFYDRNNNDNDDCNALVIALILVINNSCINICGIDSI